MVSNRYSGAVVDYFLAPKRAATTWDDFVASLKQHQITTTLMLRLTTPM